MGRPVLVAAPPPVDLALTEVSAISSSLQAGQSYPLEWEVVNEGSPTTLWNYDLWYDGLFLSTDQEWDEQDIFLKDWTQNGPLDNQGIYTDDQFFDIPNGTSGTYYLLLVADHRYQTEDRNISNNIKIVNTANANNTVFIEQVPTPDLAITNFATVSDGTAGQPFTLEYTVTNIGVATAQPDWSDKVYLSDDFIIDAEDLTLASIPNGTSLSPQQSYTKSEDVFLPQTAKGNYIIIVQTDANDALYEHQAENNNQIAFPIVVDQAPPADLKVTNIEVPTEKITSGTSYNLTWTVANEGAFPASGFTKDIIYLSTDPIWDITDIALTEWTDRIDLAPLSEETRMAEVSIAGVATGDYYIIIKTDVLNNISESREENNTSTSDNQLCITVPELQIGIAKIDTLPNNEGLIYRIEIPDSLAGQTLFTTLIGDVQNGTNELYISHRTGSWHLLCVGVWSRSRCRRTTNYYTSRNH